MLKHSRKHSSRKTNKNIKSHHNCENVTKSFIPEKDITTIHMFSNLGISDKTSQSSSCDPSCADQLIKNKKYLKFGPLGSSPGYPRHNLPDSHSPGIKQDKIWTNQVREKTFLCDGYGYALTNTNNQSIFQINGHFLQVADQNTSQGQAGAAFMMQ